MPSDQAVKGMQILEHKGLVRIPRKQLGIIRNSE